MMKHFVEFLYPGFPILNASSKEVAEREIKQLPEGAIGYRFFDGSPDKKENLSGWTYKGKRVTWQQVKQALKDNPGCGAGKDYHREKVEELLLKMQGRDVVLTEGEQMIRLYEGDTVI